MTHVYHKWRSHDVWFLKYNEQQNFFAILDFFCPFTLVTSRMIKILKKLKATCRYYHFTNVCHKWQSYEKWFLRYGSWPTEFFIFLDCLLPFTPLRRCNSYKSRGRLPNLEFLSSGSQTPKLKKYIYTW